MKKSNLNGKMTAMKILAIETSCDDTCVAVVERDKKLNFRILANVISSQVKLHAKYGGIYPFLAKREHQKNLPIVFKKALKQARNPKIDAIAVTNGPGLEPCLWTGVNFAKKLSRQRNLPIIPVNHIEAHILVNFLTTNYKLQTTNYLFPAVCLVVSGGHTQLILMRGIGKYKILGETRDDAAGECLDKAARILGLEYPGGPAIAEQARQWKFQIHPVKCRFAAISPKAKLFNRAKLPRPMMYSKDYDFSFSGLKTAVLYKVKSEKRKAKNIKYIREMCVEIQQAVIDVLLKKTIKAARDYGARTIILGGGVTANKELQKQFQQRIKKEIPDSLFLIPYSRFCTDNAAMVGVTACFHRKKIKNWKDIEVDANLRIDGII